VSKRDGASTHVRYGHGAGPTEVALLCPACGGEALATLPCWRAGVYVIGDLSPEWRSTEWRVVYTACPHRAGPFDYAQMRACAPLYLDMGATGEDFWAWNRDHLAMLIAALSARDVSSHPLGWFAHYIPGHWKADAARYVKLARRLLEK
jgi:hypothetical protein